VVPNSGWLYRFYLSCKKKNPDVITTDCFIHSGVLVSESLGDEMKKVSDDATKMFNFINQRSLESCVKTWTNGT
jgi:hypothetical protein